MARRYEQAPGSDVTLLALYDAVQAAEEFDLAEQARLDARWDELRLNAGFGVDDETADVELAVDEPADDESERPRMTQVVGLVEHLLGGRFISDG